MQIFQRIRSQAISQVPVLPTTKLLFFDTRFAWLWLIVRLYVGYQWLSSGVAKVAGYSLSPGSFGRHVQGGSWLVGGHGEKALQGFFTHSLSLAGGPNPVIQNWYAAFLQHIALPGVGVFSYLIPFGELFVGLGLILGLFTGVAAIFGALMNMNYLLAGSISINPILFLLEIFLILAWRICGFYGVDRFLLTRLRNTQTRLSTSTAQVITDEALVARE
ncbi:MAG TPA: DoxX family protein [Ktedonobacteraceae bacterium]